jgi:5'-nucleotidase
MRYRVTVNDFLSGGGDGFTALKEAAKPEVGPLDAEALEEYFRSHAEPIDAHTEGRILRSDSGSALPCALKEPPAP